MKTRQQIMQEANKWHKENCNYIYVAYSPSANIFKIGITTKPNNRLTSIRASGLGGVKDWGMHCSYKVGAGTAYTMEKDIARQLYAHNIHRNYLKHSNTKYSKEIYSCDVRIIKAAFKSLNLIIPIRSEILSKRFEEFVPSMDFLMWINLNRKNVGLSSKTFAQLKESRFYNIPDSANFF